MQRVESIVGWYVGSLCALCVFRLASFVTRSNKMRTTRNCVTVSSTVHSHNFYLYFYFYFLPSYPLTYACLYLLLDLLPTLLIIVSKRIPFYCFIAWHARSAAAWVAWVTCHSWRVQRKWILNGRNNSGITEVMPASSVCDAFCVLLCVPEHLNRLPFAMAVFPLA